MTESFLKWDPAQVATYINSLVEKDDDKRHGAAFLDNNIDGSLLPFITTEHLKEIGIDSLMLRLSIKKGISLLIADHYKKYPPKSLTDMEKYSLNNVDINNNHITLESLALTTNLIQDSVQKFNTDLLQGVLTESPISPTNDEIKKLSESFTKLKTDLIPITKLLKESKPLPTPTLDPGSATVESPSYLSYLHEHDANSEKRLSKEDSTPDTPTTTSTTASAGAGTGAGVGAGVGTGAGTGATAGLTTTPLSRDPSFTLSPASNRFSSGTLLSMGTGKIISQSVSRFADLKNAADFKLQKVGIQKSNSSKNSESQLVPVTASVPAVVRAKLGDHISTSPTNVGDIQMQEQQISHDVGKLASAAGQTGFSTAPFISTYPGPSTTNTTTTTSMIPPPPPHPPQSTTAATSLGTTAVNTALNNSSGSTVPVHPSESRPPLSSSNLKSSQVSKHDANEPLKQLRASTDDSCLKILQQAMKRHHIPRDDWSKYVLVICYGDKERILKLAEKPVVIFKKLQESGRHPAIMLRQLADATPVVDSDGSLYEDSRISSDIPGGYL